MNRTIICGVATAAMLTLAGTTEAQIKIGVTVSATGPAASLGIPEKNTVAMCPNTIAGKSVEYIVLDDATDSMPAVVAEEKNRPNPSPMTTIPATIAVYPDAGPTNESSKGPMARQAAPAETITLGPSLS